MSENLIFFFTHTHTYIYFFFIIKNYKYCYQVFMTKIQSKNLCTYKKHLFYNFTFNNFNNKKNLNFESIKIVNYY